MLALEQMALQIERGESTMRLAAAIEKHDDAADSLRRAYAARERLITAGATVPERASAARLVSMARWACRYHYDRCEAAEMRRDRALAACRAAGL